MGKKKSKAKAKAAEKAIVAAIEKANKKTNGKTNGKTTKTAAPTEPTKTPEPKKPTPGELLAEKAYALMQKLKKNGIEEFNSTLLRDKLKLDKESGRGQVRQAMKKLEKAGKVVVEQKAVKEKGARKRYTYRLR